MLEPTLVLREGRVDMKEKPEGRTAASRRALADASVGWPGRYFDGRFCGRRTRLRRRAVARRRSNLIGDYELSKNLHRLASSRAVRLAPICIAAPHSGQFQLAGLTPASGLNC
jgi:hypothetical protein